MLSLFLISQVVGAKLSKIRDVTRKLVLVCSHIDVYLELDSFFYFFLNKISPSFFYLA